MEITFNFCPYFQKFGNNSNDYLKIFRGKIILLKVFELRRSSNGCKKVCKSESYSHRKNHLVDKFFRIVINAYFFEKI